MTIGDATNTRCRCMEITGGVDFVAKRNDIVEWDGNKFVVVFQAATVKTLHM